MSRSRLAASKPAQPTITPNEPPAVVAADAAGSATLFPTETEIYLLPDGRVIVADLPAELAGVIHAIGSASNARVNALDAVQESTPCGDDRRSPHPSEDINPDQNH